MPARADVCPSEAWFITTELFWGPVLSGEWVTLGNHCDHCVVS